MATATQDWKDKLRELREADPALSERALAEAVGKAPSTVHEALAEMGLNEGASEPIPGQRTIDGDEVPAGSNGHGDESAGRDAILDQADRGEGETGLQQRPGEGPAEVVSVYVEEIRVDGTSQVALDLGGKLPASCKLSVSGSAVVDGFFRKGDRIKGTFEAVIRSAGANDKVDKQTGIVTESVQAHAAKITDLVLD